MRHSILLLTFIALSVALFFLWQFRFVVVGEQPITLTDLKATSNLSPSVAWSEAPNDANLSLRIAKDAPTPIALLNFPNLPPQRWLHVKFEIAANELVAGREIWNDGRCIMEWHAPGETDQWENQQFASVRDNQDSGSVEFVLRPNQAPAYPVLRIENIGVAGEMRVSKFEVTPLEERILWKIGRWFLMAGWIGWAIYLICFEKPISIRPILASVVWLLMGIYFVVPGPWPIIRSFSQPFQIESESTEQLRLSPRSLETVSPVRPPLNFNSTKQPLESVGKVVDKVDISLRIKMLFTQLRPLLHSLLFLVPTFLIACLVGKKPAIQLMVILAFSIEAAQMAFGYGFDRVDVVDLISDGLGIIGGLIIYSMLQRIKHPKLMALLEIRDSQMMQLEQ